VSLLFQLQKAVGSANVTSIHHGYSDACLIGAAIKCDAASAGEVVSKVASTLRSANVTDTELKAAKKAFSIEITETHLNPYMKGELLAAYALSGSGGIMSEKALLDSISQITVADVQAVAKKLANGKLSMAAVGNLGTVPYLDTL
jgi:predicted Zn-dependent peptidase